MDVELKSNALHYLITVGITFITWIVADTRSKSKIIFVEEKTNNLKDRLDSHGNTLNDHVKEFSVAMGRSELDRRTIHENMIRLDNQKASKEVVDGFRVEIASLKFDMDKRFDRIERLIETGNTKS